MNRFVSQEGDFVSDLSVNEAYFPLANFNLMGSITPDLNGDLKASNNEFFLEPSTRFGLSANKLGINIWAIFNDKDLFSLIGKSCSLLNVKRNIEKKIKAGLLWYELMCSSNLLSARILSFVDIKEDAQLVAMEITNTSKRDLCFRPVIVVPVYGRSADNIRDHRHVTSLLHRVRVFKDGLLLKPTMSFDEEGHRINETAYCVFTNGGGIGIDCIFSDYDDVVRNKDLMLPEGILGRPSNQCYGSECCFAGKFNEVRLKPSQSIKLYLSLGIVREGQSFSYLRRLCKPNEFEKAFERTKAFWRNYSRRLVFSFEDSVFSNWLKWVGIQPLLRKIYGCSFLPDFDYGRGGRGWRDLWQDLLSLLLVSPDDVRQDLIGNFAGVRIDGSNATIIGKNRGEFIADRNRITRVWMDHGVWPFLTVLLYIDQTGDYKILFEKVPYFRDNQIFRARRWDPQWDGSTVLKDRNGRIYKGTVLEHILLQHLVQFFNVGRHNLIRLENADWNDGLDMAPNKGESTAFTSFYMGNFEEIADLLEDLRDYHAIKNIEVFEEMILLFEIKKPINNLSPKAKQDLLVEFFNFVQVKGLSGKKVKVDIDKVVVDLRRKAEVLKKAVRKQIISEKGGMWVNGYFDDDGKSLEGVEKNKIKMTLTGQVFPIMKGALSFEEAKNVAATVDRYLFDKTLKGYRLNTDFGRVLPKMGRAFAFAFGEKENGAIFSHMVVMYANALFKRGLVEEGWKALESLFFLALGKNAEIYPCLPEYFNNKGRGMYAYLTGSASWYIMTLLREAIGISSVMGDLFLFPKLLKRHFGKNKNLEVSAFFRGYRILYRFTNKGLVDWPSYCIKEAVVNGVSFRHGKRGIILKFEQVKKYLSKTGENVVEVILEKCAE